MLETAQDLSGQNCSKIKIITFPEQLFKKVTLLDILLLRTGRWPPTPEARFAVDCGLAEQPWVKQRDTN